MRILGLQYITMGVFGIAYYYAVCTGYCVDYAHFYCIGVEHMCHGLDQHRSKSRIYFQQSYLIKLNKTKQNTTAHVNYTEVT